MRESLKLTPEELMKEVHDFAQGYHLCYKTDFLFEKSQGPQVTLVYTSLNI